MPLFAVGWRCAVERVRLRDAWQVGNGRCLFEGRSLENPDFSETVTFGSFRLERQLLFRVSRQPKNFTIAIFSVVVTGRLGAEQLIAQRRVSHKRKRICESDRGVEYGTV